MNDTNCPLIIGAGPVGLGAALFLALQGRPARLIEMQDDPAPQSRALAVNPRTLSILESTGVTRQMLKLGVPIRGVQFHQSGRIAATLQFDGIDSKYPFMLALSQATTERLLTEALEAAGGRVEREVRLVNCRNVDDGAEAILGHKHSGKREVLRCPWILAADGAHSLARSQLGIDFEGSSFTRDWHLADAPLKTKLATNLGHVFFLERSHFIFMIRVVNGTEQDRAENFVWRVMSNRPDPLAHLLEAKPAGAPLWTSSFHVDHRVIARLASGAVYFSGDAAHIHSPLGARGMNLGLEDVFVFARLERLGQLKQYDALRRPVDRAVVRRVEALSRIVSAESAFTRLIRSFMLPATRIPFIRKLMIDTVTGLDHRVG